MDPSLQALPNMSMKKMDKEATLLVPQMKKSMKEGVE